MIAAGRSAASRDAPPEPFRAICELEVNASRRGRPRPRDPLLAWPIRPPSRGPERVPAPFCAARSGPALDARTRSANPLAARLRRRASGDRGLRARGLDQRDAAARLRRARARRQRAARDRGVGRGALRARPPGQRRGRARRGRRRADRAGGSRPRSGSCPPACGRSRSRTDDLPANPRFSFEQFVLGPSNRFAHASALAVAENPGTAYNPLFLCGPPGVGKTHLLHSDRRLPAAQRAVAARPAGDRRDVRQRVRRARCAAAEARDLQAPLPGQRRAARRRRAVPHGQDADRGRVLPHLQRALRRPAPR